jgi:hypothetical protein
MAQTARQSFESEPNELLESQALLNGLLEQLRQSIETLVRHGAESQVRHILSDVIAPVPTPEPPVSIPAETLDALTLVRLITVLEDAERNTRRPDRRAMLAGLKGELLELLTRKNTAARSDRIDPMTESRLHGGTARA